MVSPFTGTPLPNATLYIPRKDSGLSIDPDTGNISANEIVEEYIAYLKPDASKANRSIEDGLDFTRFPVKGRLVKPMAFPDNFFSPLIIKCDIELHSGLLKGKLELEATIEPKLVAARALKVTT